MKALSATFKIKIRFSEIDAMRVVWHGAYAKYFEDAREYFGSVYELGYDVFEENNVFAPIVDLSIQYKKPLRYGMQPEITITYRFTEAAKIIFEYEIRDADSHEIMATATSVQVFMDLNYELMWMNPPFYEDWKNKWLKE